MILVHFEMIDLIISNFLICVKKVMDKMPG